MTDLTRLKVSLTKHGAHKLAVLFRKYNASQILDCLWDKEPGINIERAQALKNLSASAAGVVPPLWDEARTHGHTFIDLLVFLAIVSSHHALLAALRKGASATKYVGRINKGDVLDGKAFTNFKHTLIELGLSTADSDQFVEYDFTKIFRTPELNVFASRLWELKLRKAKWDCKQPQLDELVALDFPKVFALDEKSFRTWYETGNASPGAMTTEDADFFSSDAPAKPPKAFKFKSGHTPKKTGTVKVKVAKAEAEAELLHNRMQTKLYGDLVAAFGAPHVGTEVPTGAGTSIDVVVDTNEFRWFYEIKTSDSVRSCIRQAIPQLLEYAYWQCKSDTADKLIVVGPAAITPEAENYLKFLRETFHLELHYEQCIV